MKPTYFNKLHNLNIDLPKIHFNNNLASPRIFTRVGDTRIAYRMLVRKPEEKTSLVKPRHKWECNIKMDIKETRWEYVKWIHLAQNKDRRRDHVNT
jgi:hypothetical protein